MSARLGLTDDSLTNMFYQGVVPQVPQLVLLVLEAVIDGCREVLGYLNSGGHQSGHA